MYLCVKNAFVNEGEGRVGSKALAGLLLQLESNVSRLSSHFPGRGVSCLVT